MQRQEGAQRRVKRKKMREHGNENERERRDEDEGRQEEGTKGRREGRNSLGLLWLTNPLGFGVAREDHLRRSLV
ncbi:hypothetical protein ACFX10_022057 [Malus domestica]